MKKKPSIYLSNEQCTPFMIGFDESKVNKASELEVFSKEFK